MDCEKHHKRLVHRRKYPGGDAPARLQTNSARWRGKRKNWKAGSPPLFPGARTSCMKPCATAKSLPGCTGRPPSSHKVWARPASGFRGSGMRSARPPFTPAKGCPWQMRRMRVYC